MESRLSLYDPRNTVALRPAGRRNQERRRQVLDPNHPRQGKLKIMDHQPKVAMSAVCRFCNRGQGDVGTRAICRFCRSCQYCGLIPSGSHACEFCGNRDLDRSPVRRERKLATHSPRERVKKRKGIVRRSGPQMRVRRRGAAI